MKRVLFLIGCFLSLTACQHNDICIEDQPATPKLVIKFYDAAHPGVLKPVTNFNAKALNSTSFYFEKPVNDTVVSIPLRTYENFTSYRFVAARDSLEINSDTIKFTYTPEEIYISRACGYRDIFTDFNTTVKQENNTSNWIKAIEIQQPNAITNEDDVHLFIYH